MNVQARMLTVEPEAPVRFRLLVRHFLERFFSNEMASSDGEGKARLIQIACAIGLPGFMTALYLYPAYHDIRAPRPYWGQVSDHYFYVVYSLVALGVVTLFEWDFFFPDLLDVQVLSILPVGERKLFSARIAAIALFVAGFLFDSNFLAPLALPAAIDPPGLLRFLAAHLLAVAMSGTFAAAFVLALQGVLLSLLGQHLFRRISLLLQGLSITLLLTLLLLSPVLSEALPRCMRADTTAVLCFPPFWFLGLYQRVLEGPSALPVYAHLAQTGCMATLLMIALAILSYPFAYRRRTRELMEGSASRSTHGWFSGLFGKALHSTVWRNPTGSAISHFIGQTLARVPRYRIYLVMYGGLGVALIAPCAVRFNPAGSGIHFGFSSSGLRAAVPIVAFWTIAGLRTSFLSPADQRGSWIFRVIRGRPGLEQLTAARQWVLLWGMLLSLGVFALVRAVAPHELSGWNASLIQLLVATGLCLLLTDIFFLNVKTIPFTGLRAASPTRLAWVITLYIGCFPLLILLTLYLETWMEASLGHLAIAAVTATAAHLGLRMIHRKIVAEYTSQIDLDEDQEEFPQTLGLRY